MSRSTTTHDVCDAVSVVGNLHVGGGAVLAKPCLDAERSTIYCSTLSGFLTAISMVRVS